VRFSNRHWLTAALAVGLLGLETRLAMAQTVLPNAAGQGIAVAAPQETESGARLTMNGRGGGRQKRAGKRQRKARAARRALAATLAAAFAGMGGSSDTPRSGFAFAGSGGRSEETAASESGDFRQGAGPVSETRFKQSALDLASVPLFSSETTAAPNSSNETTAGPLFANEAEPSVSSLDLSNTGLTPVLLATSELVTHQSSGELPAAEVPFSVASDERADSVQNLAAERGGPFEAASADLSGSGTSFEAASVDLSGPGTSDVAVASFDAADVSAVPEPASLALMLPGLAALAFFKRRQKQNVV